MDKTNGGCATSDDSFLCRNVGLAAINVNFTTLQFPYKLIAFRMIHLLGEGDFFSFFLFFCIDNLLLQGHFFPQYV